MKELFFNHPRCLKHLINILCNLDFIPTPHKVRVTHLFVCIHVNTICFHSLVHNGALLIVNLSSFLDKVGVGIQR